MHLLLASQRLEEGRLRGLDTHLSYRIGLRTFSASESRAVLGVADAYELPPVPGSAYLKIDTDTLMRFKAAYVSGELPAAASVGGEDRPPGSVLPFTLSRVATPVCRTRPRRPTPGTPALPEPAPARRSWAPWWPDWPGKRTGRPPDLAAAAGRTARPWTSCCRRWARTRSAA